MTINLTFGKCDLIRNKTFCGQNYIKIGLATDSGIKLDLPLDEIEDIQGHVAAAANHTKNLKLQNELYRFFDKLQFFLDTFLGEENERKN